MSTLDAARRHARNGNVSVALAEVDAVLQSVPADANALFSRAYVLLHAGRFIECLAFSRMALDAGLCSPDLLRQIGDCHLQLADFRAAEESLRAALDLDPESLQTLRALCTALQRMHRWEDSLPIAETIVARQPDIAYGWLLCGNAYLNLRRVQDAERSFRQAAMIAPTDSMPWTKLGVALASQSRHDDAIAAFARAVDTESGVLFEDEAFVNLAIELHANGDVALANELYRRNLGATQSIAGFFNFSMSRLADGKLREGWHYNEFRWLLDPLRSLRPTYRRPVWNGQPIDGKTVLIRCEQGFGDNIQFLRYATLVKACGATVVLRPRSGMEGLADRFPGVDRVLQPDADAHFDYYVHVMSLPRIFGTDAHSIPPQSPCLAADPDRVAKWRHAISRGARLKVGVVWAGTPAHAHDSARSIAFDEFRPLFDAPDVHFYSLQMGDAARPLARHRPANVTSVGEQIQDFGDTAAVIELLDLVVSVDTATAHLAGAMGKPVWMLNATPGDWRWRGTGESTPWYPSMRIFRQQSPGEWTSVIELVRRELATTITSAIDTPRAAQSPASPPVALDPAAQVEGFDIVGGVAECRFGIVQYLPEDVLTSTAIRWYGEHLSAYLELLGPLIPRGGTVLEFASGVGLHALALSAKLGSDGHLIVCERDGILCTILRHNLSANRVRNVTVLAQPPVSDQAWPNVDDLRLAHLALIKLGQSADAVDIINSASDTLWRLRPAIFVDALDANAVIRASDALRDYGYRCWHMETPLFDAGNFNNRRENVFGDATAHAMLAVPEEVEPGTGLREFKELA
jgi:tetratricopeptide (TPR) repeat protein